MAKTKRGREWNWKEELESNLLMGDIQRGIITRLHQPGFVKFKLDDAFVDEFKDRPVPFGFNGLGELTFRRSYSRPKGDGTNEEWFETIARVVDGTYNMQKRWVLERGLGWSEHKAQESAQEMYRRMFQMKFLPPGRGLWAMGSEITEERGLYAALNNCAFVSTENLGENGEHPSNPFKFLMDMSMAGVGVGFDTLGAGKILVRGPDNRRDREEVVIPDSREGWVEATGRLIDSYFYGTSPVKMNYSKIRRRGQKIKGFGGESSGSRPLEEMHEYITRVLESNRGKPLTSRAIVDIQNLIGKCVVSGNVRRSAEIAFGSPKDKAFLDLKNYRRNPEREDFGWASNNSVLGNIGMDYGEISERIKNNGEPGIIWLENMRRFGRMGDLPNDKDRRAKGCNPCAEQTLESYEVCNLVETFPRHHANVADYLATLKYAYLYAKTVSLGETHWPETNRVLLRNRRIGCSVSGVQQFLQGRSINDFREWLEAGYDTIQKYDKEYSGWLTVPTSIKTTSVKPSGSISLVAGASPGMHWPVSSGYYLRRIMLARDSGLVPPIREAGYNIVDSVYDKSSVVVEFPIESEAGIRSEEQVSLWEQLNMAAFLQKYWADNQVSFTAKFDPKTEGQDLSRALDHFQYQLKSVSFLPKTVGTYQQAPYEPITREEYFKRMERIRPVNYAGKSLDSAIERGCDGDKCVVEPKT